ncbi:protein ABHD15-like [Sycon ciliatum]|uniref:protein ABHD15-like n=1 Tax=Sycon ciliatum TaxID=27933 RepID=UPI0020AA978A|eukprot:scpid52893/ scgid31894/ Abhydrolase domain-containing protein 15
MDVVYLALTYPVRVVWHTLRTLFLPCRSNVELVHGNGSPPEWLDAFKKACSALDGFVPTPWAPGALSQTILGSTVFSMDSTVKFRRELLNTPDGDVVVLDWVCAESDAATTQHGTHADSEDSTPICLILHGINGNSSYVAAGARVAMEHGMRAVGVNKRGHAEGVDLLQPRLMSLTDPTDVRLIVTTLKSRHPSAPLFLVGCSAGAAQASCYLMDYPDDHLLDGVVCVSHGFDARQLFEGGCLVWPYSYYMLKGLKDFVEKNKRALGKCIDLDEVRRTSTCVDYYTNVDVRIYGAESFPALVGFEEKLSSFQRADVPFACIHSRDDPVIPAKMIPFDVIGGKKDSLLILSDHGGHCGFLEGWSGRRWDFHVACSFLQQVSSWKAKKE